MLWNLIVKGEVHTKGESKLCHLSSSSSQTWRFLSPSLQKWSISKTAESTGFKFKLAFRKHACIYQSSEWKTTLYIWYRYFGILYNQMSLNAPVVFQNFIHYILALDWCIGTWYSNNPFSWKTRIIFTFPLPWDISVKTICLEVSVMIFLQTIFQ